MWRKIKGFIKNNWILLLILLLGIVLRSYKTLEYFMYSHDQDLAGWIVKDILVNHHLRLIGQQTSSMGVFIGPYYYYLQIPFYLITHMDPAGPVFLSIILGGVSIFSFYYVFRKIFSKEVGLITSLFYSVSILTVFTDREVVPTIFVMLWSVWFFYSIWNLYKGNQKFYLLIGVLLGLAWNTNLALVLLAPLILLAHTLSKKRIEIKSIILGLVVFVLVFSPYIMFEARHGASQTKSIISSLTTSKDYGGGSKPGLAKLDRVTQIAYKNTTRLFWGNEYPSGLVKVTLFVLIATFLFLFLKKIIPRNLGIIMMFWQALYIVFFTLNSINISEYYLNGMNVVWIGTASIALGYAIKKGYMRYVMFLVFIVIALNLRSFSLYYTNGNGYMEKKALVTFIKKDAEARGYPCVAITYIAAPGYEFGFRYWFWIKGLKIKENLSGAPIYNIVFPLSYVDKFDQRFGGLGLVLPDYKSYTSKSVERACLGDDVNLTQPMFGYTQ